MLAIATLAPLACSRAAPPPPAPPSWDPQAKTQTLRYEAPASPLHHTIEFELTHTSLGLYVEAKLGLRCAVTLTADGDQLRTQWSVDEVTDLSLEGSGDPAEADEVRALLGDHGKGAVSSDDRGVLDLAATEQAPENIARREALAQLSGPAGRLLLRTIEDQLRLPRLPATALTLNEPVELEEESETVLADADQVLPTTTVHRFTLRSVSEAGLAEVAIEQATVAEADPELEAEDEVDSEPKAKSKAKSNEAEEDEPLPARMEIRSRGMLVFDLKENLPVSVQLTATQQFVLGDNEVERSLTVRSEYGHGK